MKPAIIIPKVSVESDISYISFELFINTNALGTQFLHGRDIHNLFYCKQSVFC